MEIRKCPITFSFLTPSEKSLTFLDFFTLSRKDHLLLSYTFAHLNFHDTFSWAWQSHWGFSLLWSSDFKSWLKIWILLSRGCLITHTHKLFLQISQPPCSLGSFAPDTYFPHAGWERFHLIWPPPQAWCEGNFPVWASRNQSGSHTAAIRV